MIILAFCLLFLGLLVMFASDTFGGSAHGVVVGAVMAIDEGYTAARDALRGSAVFAVIVESNPGCEVTPNTDGSKIVITCTQGVK